MILTCQYCENSKECEYKDNYIRMCDTITNAIRGYDKLPHLHCYFSYSISCDYFYPKQKTNPCCKDGGECDNAV